MDDNQFERQVEILLQRIEDYLENSQIDLDWVQQEGMLTISLANQQQLIISRQRAIHELWLAAPQAAYHFKFINQGWYTLTQAELLTTVQQIVEANSL